MSKSNTTARVASYSCCTAVGDAQHCPVFFTPGVQLRSSDPQLQELKAVAVERRHIIKNYLGVSISESHTPIAFPLLVALGIAQKLLGKLDLRLKYIGRLGK